MCLIVATSSVEFYKNLILHDSLQRGHARLRSHVARNRRVNGWTFGLTNRVKFSFPLVGN
jgi:hypothetical protein